MKSKRRGFTLIEVALFLALTGVLFTMVIVGVSDAVYSQRYNDSVQGFAEFLKTVYSGVENVQNYVSSGRSDKAIYGKLVVFGAEVDLTGAEVSDSNTIYVYNVIGNASGSGVNSLVEALQAVNVNVFEGENDYGFYEFAGIVESYTPKWSAEIQKTDSNDKFTGAILIVRHPGSGTINTMVYSGNKFNRLNATDEYNVEKILINNLSNFTVKEADFCVSMEETSSIRRDVQIIKNANNISGINILAAEDNPCML